MPDIAFTIICADSGLHNQAGVDGYQIPCLETLNGLQCFYTAWDFSFNLSFLIPPLIDLSHLFSLGSSKSPTAAKLLRLLSFALECTSQQYLTRVWSAAARLCFCVSCSHKSPPKLSQDTRALGRKEEADQHRRWKFPTHSLRRQLLPSMFSTHLIQQTQNTVTTKDKIQMVDFSNGEVIKAE